MTLAIVLVMLLCYILMATEHLTHLNKASVAVFFGTVGWILYMCTGTSFINGLHAEEFQDFLDGSPYSLLASKQFIADHIFLHYVGQIGSLALYLLSTMAIVEVLMNNECFWFLNLWLRRRSTTQVLATSVVVTFLMSCNLDNLTTTVLMLMILRRILRNPRQRMYICSAVVIAANCGGVLTVIGDVTSLMLWSKGAVTATNYSLTLLLPSVVATAIPAFLIRRRLPETVDIERPTYSFNGDDSTLAVWQKVLMLILGFGGLWFIPTFHRITQLPPFLGALCVLGVMWAVNEGMNMSRIKTEQPQSIGLSRSLQYEVLQLIMFCVGVCLCVDVMIESGAMRTAAEWCDQNLHDIYLISIILGLVSSVLDNMALVMAGINIYSVIPDGMLENVYQESFMLDGQYWQLVTLSGCVGGCIFPIGSAAGYALMRAEDMTFMWYVKRVSLFATVGWLASLGVFFLVDACLRGYFPHF